MFEISGTTAMDHMRVRQVGRVRSEELNDVKHALIAVVGMQ